MGVHSGDWPQGHAVHEIEIHVESTALPERASIAERPLSTGMLFRHPPNCEVLATKHALDCFFDLGALFQHGVAASGTHVVQIDVDRQSRDVEDEKVQSRSALERHLPRKKRVIANSVEHGQQSGCLFQQVGPEPGRLGFCGQLFGRDCHSTSPHDRWSTSFGTTRFQSATRQPEFLLVRSR